MSYGLVKVAEEIENGAVPGEVGGGGTLLLYAVGIVFGLGVIMGWAMLACFPSAIQTLINCRGRAGSSGPAASEGEISAEQAG